MSNANTTIKTLTAEQIAEKLWLEGQIDRDEPEDVANELHETDPDTNAGTYEDFWKFATEWQEGRNGPITTADTHTAIQFYLTQLIDDLPNDTKIDLSETTLDDIEAELNSWTGEWIDEVNEKIEDLDGEEEEEEMCCCRCGKGIVPCSHEHDECLLVNDGEDIVCPDCVTPEDLDDEEEEED